MNKNFTWEQEMKKIITLKIKKEMVNKQKKIKQRNKTPEIE